MGKIYDNQTDLTIRLHTGKNLEGITDVKIQYRNPLNELGDFQAVVVDSEKGVISYSVTEPLVNVGEWRVWAKVVDSSGLISIGEPSVFNVYKTGN